MKKEMTYLYEMKSNSFSALSFVFILIMSLLTIFIVRITDTILILSSVDILLILILLMPYFIFHEILHCIGYVINGAKLKNITFGIHLENGILCCSCKQSINKKTALWSLAFPLVFIGIITYIIGFIYKLPILIFLSIANISGCVGDIIMFSAFIRLKEFNFFEYDNPLAFGIITNENLDSKKMFGLKKIQEENIKQTINKKITISKTSILILIIYYAVIFISLFF